MTNKGKQILASLYSNVFAVEHKNVLEKNVFTTTLTPLKVVHHPSKKEKKVDNEHKSDNETDHDVFVKSIPTKVDNFFSDQDKKEIEK